MNLTEPQAGSDVGAVRTRPSRTATAPIAVTGQKIFISWGDHDLAENVCHLVLARLPDGAPGTKGISLFLVPKYLPDGDGRPGVANAVKVISLEHKMGLHGSPTCVMEYERATGWLVGEPHQGMAAMFTMMNNARLGVGMQGLAQAEAALQAALGFARERRQGRTPDRRGDDPRACRRAADARDHGRDGGDGAGDLPRLRALHRHGRATGEAAWAARAAFLTPIAKAFGTDVGCEVSALAMQVFGGMGYVEETGVAQFYRDVRVTAIYEGTNGIQAMDLVGRKLADGGAAARALIAEVEATAKADAGALGAGLAAAARRLARRPTGCWRRRRTTASPGRRPTCAPSR